MLPHWVFVWTISDLVGVALLGLCALFFGGLFLLLGIDVLWFKMTGKHLPYNKPNGIK